jgi:hypothetical protein
MTAVDAAVAVAREHGVYVDDPVVLRDAWHVLVHLRPAPLVARVSVGGSGDVVRELVVARHAARNGAPVIEPTDLLDPGPHERDGYVLVFWTFVEDGGELDAMLAALPPGADAELLRELASRTLPAGQALHGDAHVFNCMQTP